jgi:hypothetical protein
MVAEVVGVNLEVITKVWNTSWTGYISNRIAVDGDGDWLVIA